MSHIVRKKTSDTYDCLEDSPAGEMLQEGVYRFFDQRKILKNELSIYVHFLLSCAELENICPAIKH